MFYKVGERFYTSLSVSHIHQPNITYPITTENSSASFLRRHYFGTAGYSFRLLNSPIELQPSAFVKFDGTKLQYSGNISALYNKKIRLGVSYRNREAIIPMITFELISGLKVGYAYELALTRLISVSKGSHEIFIGYCFDSYSAIFQVSSGELSSTTIYSKSNLPLSIILSISSNNKGRFLASLYVGIINDIFFIHFF